MLGYFIIKYQHTNITTVLSEKSSGTEKFLRLWTCIFIFQNSHFCLKVWTLSLETNTENSCFPWSDMTGSLHLWGRCLLNTQVWIIIVYELFFIEKWCSMKKSNLFSLQLNHTSTVLFFDNNCTLICSRGALSVFPILSHRVLKRCVFRAEFNKINFYYIMNIRQWGQHAYLFIFILICVWVKNTVAISIFCCHWLDSCW